MLLLLVSPPPRKEAAERGWKREEEAGQATHSHAYGPTRFPLSARLGKEEEEST